MDYIPPAAGRNGKSGNMYHGMLLMVGRKLIWSMMKKHIMVN